MYFWINHTHARGRNAYIINFNRMNISNIFMDTEELKPAETTSYVEHNFTLDVCLADKITRILQASRRKIIGKRLFKQYIFQSKWCPIKKITIVP
jgi:hypothetical protein